jgi:hypothetical protein
MNPIWPRMSTGCIGELLVQIRLLQYGVQAAPPIEDTGNDLIAVNRNQFRAVSVRTTKSDRYTKPDERRFHVLAVVRLDGTDNELYLDGSEIFLIPFEAVAGASTDCNQLTDFRLTREHIAQTFGELKE